MTGIDPEEYTDPAELLQALQPKAWRDQTHVLAGRRNSKYVHIPQDSDTRESICCHGPDGECPTLAETNAYPGVWREDMQWCNYCLTLEYLGVDYRRLDAWLDDLHSEDPAPEPQDAEPVVSVRTDGGVYHTRECGNYPSEVREPTPGELREFEECGMCRTTPREGVPE